MLQLVERSLDVAPGAQDIVLGSLQPVVQATKSFINV